MSLNTKKVVVAVLSIFFMLSLLIVAWIEGGRNRVLDHPNAVVTSENKDCVSCHTTKTPGIVGQWKESKHSQSGVGCYNCHKADKGDKDAFEHEGKTIATIVSPKDCSNCHPKEYKEFQDSHHSDAGKILGSLDNVLAEVVEGFTEFNEKGEKTKESPAAVSGCLQCHGSEIKVLANGKLDPATWPNTGIGRLNPDGSRGACSACHMRHNFSMAQSRQPENCGRCHMGPDHPQLEIYNESKHGIAFTANRERFVKGMNEREWLPGTHYEQGPTCSSCHMGATKDLPITHDVGARISWTLRPPVSEKIDEGAKKSGKTVKTWENRRKDMEKVCKSCHGDEWIANWYKQFDNLVELYNGKFGKPATELYNMIRSGGLISADVTFDDKIEFTYFFLWHHEGRRARHGAAMMGPDYTQWHGMYEVADRFYHEFIPELKEVIEKGKRSGKAAQASAVEKRMNEILNSPMHQWFIGKMSPAEKEARKKASDAFKKRYAQ
ncbi:MAG: hydroxylamine oxidoreductase [Leptospiraceae bacterium]|nr:hydroxylamine oxidoreductase [Leptospiraceae bacterium]